LFGAADRWKKKHEGDESNKKKTTTFGSAFVVSLMKFRKQKATYDRVRYDVRLPMQPIRFD
jgi:hypothetical protein